jgi:hypothetical protein
MVENYERVNPLDIYNSGSTSGTFLTTSAPVGARTYSTTDLGLGQTTGGGR